MPYFIHYSLAVSFKFLKSFLILDSLALSAPTPLSREFKALNMGFRPPRPSSLKIVDLKLPNAAWGS